MNAMGIAAIVALGSIIGAVIATPAAAAEVVVTFVLVNVLVASLTFSIGGAVLAYLRNPRRIR
jgi:threonine/homoserine efflux transporter RhtA